jgi:integrase/recombinase XerD
MSCSAAGYSSNATMKEITPVEQARLAALGSSGPLVRMQEKRFVMLTIYRRHVKSCEHRSEGRAYRRCKCPVWVDGFLGDRDLRKSLNTRDWQKALEKIREWEARGTIKQEKEEVLVPIDAATASFINDAKARELREPTLYKYRLLFKRLKEFAAHHGLRYIAELDLQCLRDFRAGWPDHNLAALKKLERLRAFFRYCQDSSWIANNPAMKLKNPKVTQPPTLPFSQQQVIDIVAACRHYPDRRNVVRLRALILLLRYSGLRIRDAVT